MTKREMYEKNTEEILIPMTEELGFEPRRRLPDLAVFKTAPFSHLGTPPKIYILI